MASSTSGVLVMPALNHQDSTNSTPNSDDNASTSTSSTPLLPTTTKEYQPTRAIGLLGLTAMAFLMCGGGPYGLEDAVGAAGCLPVLIGLVVVPLCWALPQSLITAELSCLFDENGGYVLWVQRGLGDLPGFIASYNRLASNICDLPLYVTLFADYLVAFLARTAGVQLTGLEAWAIKAAVLVAVLALNCRSKLVSAASALGMVLILAPFAVEVGVGWRFVTSSEGPGNWLSVADTINWPVFASTLLWNYQGWDSLGCVAGEVKDGARTYSTGVLLALLVITLSYIVPVMVGVCVEGDLSQWQSGQFVTVASTLSPALGVAVTLGAIVSQFGEFNVLLCSDARALWAMGKNKMLPRLFGISSQAGTPVVALLAHSVTTAILMSFPFSVLVVVDTMFNNVGLLFETASFVALRFRRPDAVRPFAVPGGIKVACLATVPMFGVLLFGLWSAGYKALLIGAGFNVLFVAAYYARRWAVGDEMVVAAVVVPGNDLHSVAGDSVAVVEVVQQA